MHQTRAITWNINGVIIAYRDESESKYFMSDSNVGADLSNPGFKTIYKRKEGGRRFTELLDKVSMINPEVINHPSIHQQYVQQRLIFDIRCVFDSLHLTPKISLPTYYI